MYITIAILLSIIYGIAIGTNDAANSFGDWIGARVGPVRLGLILCGIFAFVGAFLEGGKVVKTIGGGIIPKIYITPEIAVIGIVAAILWVFIASYLGFPISTTHSAVGGVFGIGLSLVLFNKMKFNEINLNVIKNIIICWISTPTGAALIGFIIGYIVLSIVKRAKIHRSATTFSKILLTISSSYVAYTWGANDVANSVALLAGSGIVSSKTACIIGGASIAFGAIIFGKKVAETVGFKITNINPIMGVCADFACAFTIHFFTQIKMPVSTTHALVGAIAGVGLARGVNIVNFRILRDIASAWVLTPIICCCLTFIVFSLFKIIGIM